MSFQTEVSFELPKGYVDANGEVHKRGVMRLATAADEIIPLKDPRVKSNPGYLSIMLLSRVITKLGTLEEINTDIIEQLFTADIAYLQELYQSINAIEPIYIRQTCPNCNHTFTIEVPSLGES